ncbi:hypothetical protein FRC08_010849 [Ceratobasidium sp. 394]|nr:hypothetical protein FRC08_010849 [Ceratobasidium sp. 394]
MNVLASPINLAIESWKTVHNQLANTINAYASACVSVQFAFSSARPSFYEDHRDFDAALLTIEAELQKLELHREVLENGIRSLRRARNLSYSLVPINALPQSLLLSIFSYFTDPEYAKLAHLPAISRRNQSDPRSVILSVCTSWRNLALATPSFWSTVLFHPEDRENQSAQLSLVRAGNAILDVQVNFPKAQNSYEGWLPLLHPRYDRIRSLNLVLPNMDLLRTSLAIWPQGNLARPLKTLSVKIIRTVYQIGATLPKVLPDGAHDRFLESLTSFSLYGGYFDWDSAAFVGLEHLQLGWIVEPGPTLGQIAGMLRASPRLRTLCLAEISIAQEKKTYREPVHLEDLQRLSLMFSQNNDLCALIPLLCPGSRPLSLHLDNEFGSNRVLRLFSKLFKRSTVESIYIHRRIAQDAMPSIFSALPHLRYLHCSRNDIEDVFEALTAPLSTRNSDVPCPQLSTLHFFKCRFEAAVERLLGPITNQPDLVVKFEECAIPDAKKLLRYELGSGQVYFEFPDTDSLEPSFDGVDHVRLMALHLDSGSLGPNTMSLHLIPNMKA